MCTVFEKKDALKNLHEDFEDTGKHSADGLISNMPNFEFNLIMCFQLLTKCLQMQNAILIS